MTSSAASIVPITITVNDRTGVTLWAPPWEDDDGEEWQGFLGDGSKILLYPSTGDLAAFVASGQENDLSDHPAWGQVLRATPDDLRPSTEDRYDLDLVYEWASGEPDPVQVSALADVVDMVANIADCCDDGALRGLVDTPAYAELVDEEISYQGKEGRKRWNELGDVIADSWERAISRVDSWLSWQGDFSHTEFDEEETLWERIGAEPIEITLPDSVVLTVRGVVPDDPDTAEQGAVVAGETEQEVVAAYDAGDEYEVGFLGHPDAVAVFTDVAGLAHYCRTATGHRLRKLEWWDELADVEDDDMFAPEDDGHIDLRRPSVDGAELLLQLSYFCRLDADLSQLAGVEDDDSDEEVVANISRLDRDDWNTMVAEVVTCLRVES